MGYRSRLVFCTVIVVSFVIIIEDWIYFKNINNEKFNNAILKFFSHRTLENYLAVESTRMFWIVIWHSINILRHIYVMLYIEDPGMRQEGAKYGILKDFLKTVSFYSIKSPLLYIYGLAKLFGLENLKFSLAYIMKDDQLNVNYYAITFAYFVFIYSMQIILSSIFDVSYFCAPLYYLISEGLKTQLEFETIFSESVDLTNANFGRAEFLVSFTKNFMRNHGISVSDFKITLLNSKDIFVFLKKTSSNRMNLFLTSALAEKMKSLGHIKALIKTEFFLKTSLEFDHVTSVCKHTFMVILVLSLVPRLYKALGFPHTNSWYLKIAYFYSIIVPFEVVYAIIKNNRIHDLVKAADIKTASLSFEDKQNLTEALKIIGEQSLYHIYESKVFSLLNHVYPTIVERLENLQTV